MGLVTITQINTEHILRCEITTHLSIWVDVIIYSSISNLLFVFATRHVIFWAHVSFPVILEPFLVGLSPICPTLSSAFYQKLFQMLRVAHLDH